MSLEAGQYGLEDPVQDGRDLVGRPFLDVAEFDESAVSESRDGSFHRRDADVQLSREARDLWPDKAGGAIHSAFQIAQNLLGQVVWQARRPSSRSSCGSMFHGSLPDSYLFLMNHGIDALRSL